MAYLYRVSRVVLLWEAFLLLMNDFDRLLQIELRQMLDPVVAAPAPPRKGLPKRKRFAIPALTSPVELVAGPLPAIEAAPVTVSVAVARLVP
jgi:hypothetical protein